MSEQHINIDTNLGPVGAVVTGVDLALPLSDGVLNEIKNAWYQHHVLFFPGQDLTPTQQAEFGARFGELDIYPFMKAVDSHKNVIPIIKEKAAKMNFGGAWHTDSSYLQKPPMATLLYAVEVPDEGGDTLFADASAAYDDLSPTLQRILESHAGVFSPKVVHGQGGAYADLAAKSSDLGGAYDGADSGRSDFAESEVEHPLIRVHPNTGRKSIYCSRPHTHRIKGMTREESLPIFDFLQAHLTQDKYVTRFKWHKGTLAMWDNRCLFHNALNDYQGQRRHMLRVIVQGEQPY